MTIPNVDTLLPTLTPIFAGSVRAWRSHQVNLDGENLIPTDLTALKVQVYKESDNSLVGEFDLTSQIGDIVFPTLQTETGNMAWKADGEGFNFEHHTTPAMTPTAGVTYLFIYRATPDVGDPWQFGFRQPTFSKNFQ